MNSIYTNLLKLSLIILVVLSATACGQKGDLYLPTDTHETTK